jgi:hypothetical protein
MGTATTPFRFVAADDYAGMVSAAIRNPEAANQRLPVVGPQAMSLREAMTTYCTLVATDAKVSITPFWMMKMLNRLFMGSKLRHVIALMEMNQQLGDTADASLTTRLVGAATTTLDQW